MGRGNVWVRRSGRPASDPAAGGGRRPDRGPPGQGVHPGVRLERAARVLPPRPPGRGHPGGGGRAALGADPAGHGGAPRGAGPARHDRVGLLGPPGPAGLGPIGNERGRGFLQHNSLAVLPGSAAGARAGVPTTGGPAAGPGRGERVPAAEAAAGVGPVGGRVPGRGPAAGRVPLGRRVRPGRGRLRGHGGGPGGRARLPGPGGPEPPGLRHPGPRPPGVPARTTPGRWPAGRGHGGHPGPRRPAGTDGPRVPGGGAGAGSRPRPGRPGGSPGRPGRRGSSGSGSRTRRPESRSPWSGCSDRGRRRRRRGAERPAGLVRPPPWSSSLPRHREERLRARRTGGSNGRPDGGLPGGLVGGGRPGLPDCGRPRRPSGRPRPGKPAGGRGPRHPPLPRAHRRTFTVRQFVRGIARLGGFLGRKGTATPASEPCGGAISGCTTCCSGSGSSTPTRTIPADVPDLLVIVSPSGRRTGANPGS